MGYALQEKEATSQGLTQADAKLETEPTRQPSDLVPEENKALGKGPEAAGKTDAKDPAAEAAEKERAAKVTAKWESMLGKWLGGKLAPLVLEHVSLDALNGYVKEGLDAAGPAIGKALKDQTKPDAAQEQALKEFSGALSGVVTGQVDKWVQSETGQKVLKAISEWVEESPAWVMSIIGTAIIGGAVAVWFTNQDIPNLEVPLKLGGTEIKAGLDLGKIQELGFQGASLVVANKNAKITTKAEVKRTEKDDKTTTSGHLELAHGDKGKEDLTFVMNGTMTKGKDGLVAHTADGTLSLIDPTSGAKITIGADGKWDSTGAGDKGVKFTAETGADAALSGKLTLGARQVTVVDQAGNIVDVTSTELGVAVGTKAVKFEASVKDEGGKTTVGLGASGEAQLGAGNLFKGAANVSVGEGVTTIKLNGQMKTTVGGKEVTFDAAYQKDGPITGRLQIGEGGQYKEVSGTKNGDIVTFATKDVFEGGSVTRESERNNATGQVTNQTTVTSQLAANTTLTASGGDKGHRLGIEANQIGGSSLNAHGHVDDKGFGLGGSLDEGWFKANLDYTMKQGLSSLNLGASVTSEKGFTGETALKIDEDRLKEFSLRLGYTGTDDLKSVLVGYKREWMSDNQQYADKFDALLEYSLGNWAARASGGVDLMGGQVKKTNLDLTLGRKLDDKWAAFGGVEMNGAFNEDNHAMKQSFKPYVGLQYGNIGVAGFYDTGSKAAGVMLTIPLKF